MSSWGISNFENDSALDWIERLVLRGDEKLIKNTITKFVQNFDPEESTLIECSEFLACVEVLAALIGKPAEDFPENAKDWVELKYTKIEQDVINKAKSGVENILKDSEAREMFEGSGYFKTWKEIQRNLIKRLSE